jgi:hypothetical protein
LSFMRPNAGAKCARIICSWRSKVEIRTVPFTESESHRAKFSPTVRLPASNVRPLSRSARAFESFAATSERVSLPPRWMISQSILAALEGRSMQDPASELRRTPLLGGWVNKKSKRSGTPLRPGHDVSLNLELAADRWCYQVAGIGCGWPAARAASGCFHISYASGHSATMPAAPCT